MAGVALYIFNSKMAEPVEPIKPPEPEKPAEPVIIRVQSEASSTTPDFLKLVFAVLGFLVMVLPIAITNIYDLLILESFINGDFSSERPDISDIISTLMYFIALGLPEILITILYYKKPEASLGMIWLYTIGQCLSFYLNFIYAKYIGAAFAETFSLI